MGKPSRKKRRASPVVVPAQVKDIPVEPVKRKSGRPSYADKAMKAGVFWDIAYTIVSLKQNNLEITVKDIYRTLNSMYPEVFDKEDMDGGNATKILTANKIWELALGINKDVENMFMELRMYSIFHQQDAKNSDVIKAYTAIKNAERELAGTNNGADNVINVFMTMDGD